MNINRGNIDEHLFEYFEEQLSPIQADALMDFIHQNPEFEKDFVQWKKAYHHKDHVTEDYGIAAKIKGSIQIHKGFKAYYFSGILVLGLALGWLINSVSGLNGNDTNIAIVQTIQQNEIGEKSLGSNTVVKEKTGALSNPNRKIQVQEIEVMEGGAIEETKPGSVIDHELNSIVESDEPKSNNEEAIETESPALKERDLTVAEGDSSLEVHEIQTPDKGKSAPQKQKKKYNGKRKGMFSTTDKILPVNTNF
jgi:hypothetical protein